jgi:hypothetical protein
MSAIILKVDTHFLPNVGERVAVRDKFCQQAIKYHEPLILKHDAKYMTILPDEIVTRRIGISKKAFPDLLGGVDNYLWYFKFVADRPKQMEAKL